MEFTSTGEEIVDHLLEVNARDEAELGEVVEERLRPLLPDSFREVRGVQVFLVLDAIRMLIHDWARAYGVCPEVFDGAVWYGGMVVIPRTTVDTAASRLAELSLGDAHGLVEWAVETAVGFPGLIPGVQLVGWGRIELVGYSVDGELWV